MTYFPDSNITPEFDARFSRAPNTIFLGGPNAHLQAAHPAAVEFLQRVVKTLEDIAADRAENDETEMIEILFELDSLASHMDPTRDLPQQDVRILIDFIKQNNERAGHPKYLLFWKKTVSDQVNAAGIHLQNNYPGCVVFK